MEHKDIKFIAEVYHLIKQIEELVEGSDMAHRVMAAIFVGVIDEGEMEDLAKREEEFGHVNMRSMYSFNVENKQELEVIKDIMDEAYDNQDPDLDDLLNGLGISLN
jgi:hypothetical protein